MADHAGRRPDPAPEAQVTVDLGRGEVIVRTSEGEEVVVDLAGHREDVVRRLLDRGVSVGTLRALLPDWDPLIAKVVDGNGAR